MRIVLIVEAPADWRDAVAKLRAAGFTHEQLDIFMQPDAALGRLPEPVDNVIIRKLSTGYFYTDIIKQIVRWWSMEQDGHQFLMLFDCTCDIRPDCRYTLDLALSTKLPWGMLSLFLPQPLGEHFNGMALGWHTNYYPVPLIACCLSRQAVDLLVRQEAFVQAPHDIGLFQQIIYAALESRSLVQACHYPSLTTTTEHSRVATRGFLYELRLQFFDTEVECVSLDGPDLCEDQPGESGDVVDKRPAPTGQLPDADTARP